MPDYTTLGISFPVPSDTIKIASLEAKLADDIRLTAITANQAIITEGGRAETAAKSAAAADASAKDAAINAKATSAVSTANNALAVSSGASADAGNAVDRVTALESAAGFGPSTPTDGTMANFIANPESLTAGALSAAIGESFEKNIRGKAPASSLAPIYIETRDTGLAPSTPANLRTGIPNISMPGGGYAQELSIAVTGTAGSKVLNSTEPSKVAALGTDPFAAALNSEDGKDDLFATVLSHNGSNQITLRHPLEHSFTGTLSAKYDLASGQHLTYAGTRAYIQHALGYSGVIGTRRDILAGTFQNLPPAHNQIWQPNAANIAYGNVLSPAPYVRTGVVTEAWTLNVLHPTDRIELNPAREVSGVVIGAHKKGHGATAVVQTGKKDATLDFWVSAHRTPESAASYILRVRITGDGATLYDEMLDGWLNHIVLPISGYSTIIVEVTNENPTDTPYNISLTDTIVSEVDNGGRIGRGKIVMLGDSWFGYYDGGAANILIEKTGAEVVNRGVGGMSTEWALAWFDDYVAKEQPDECWIHFFTNDLNNNQTGATFTAPDGSTKPLWPVGLTPEQSEALWARNVNTLVQRCRESGVRPVVFMPGGTASETQMQRHAGAASRLVNAPLVDGWQALPAELADPGAYINTQGKFTGRRAMSGAAPKYATGPAAADPWI